MKERILGSNGLRVGEVGLGCWQFGGDFPWQVDINEVHEGTFSARGADVANGQSSEMFLDYFVAADSDLSFWFKVSSEFSFDFLYFLLDGQIV